MERFDCRFVVVLVLVLVLFCSPPPAARSVEDRTRETNVPGRPHVFETHKACLAHGYELAHPHQHLQEESGYHVSVGWLPL